MAVALGRERIRETAGILGIWAVDTPEEALQTRFYSDIWNTSSDAIKSALAPEQSAIVTGSKISAYDIGLEGMGQGYAGQMTPFQMALIASAPANMNGNLMKPKIEFDQPPEVYSNVVSTQQAEQNTADYGTCNRRFGRNGDESFRQRPRRRNSFRRKNRNGGKTRARV